MSEARPLREGERWKQGAPQMLDGLRRILYI